MTSATVNLKPADAAAGSLKDVIAAPTSISTIDGIEGKLIYRGYSIEDLAANTTFDEVVYLLWEGDLPNRVQLVVSKPTRRGPRRPAGHHRSSAFAAS